MSYRLIYLSDNSDLGLSYETYEEAELDQSMMSEIHGPFKIVQEIN
jgi:hypothetical protein|tara:strand:+ start:412 stop:549 length:138 start_codon:yes stop_codon:yes gene_type:complete